MKSVLRHLLNMTYDPQAVTPQNGHVQAEPLPDIIDAEDLNLERIERVAIQRALKKTAGRRREAAQILGISERTLYRKIDEYNLD
jgi:DNA-binding NtrC family response regulator